MICVIYGCDFNGGKKYKKIKTPLYKKKDII